ncbi:MAG TPA: PAS domain S-box protein [Dehalococcoidales bacterium]|nr:PAS domain S-box protein [Dehalococcoidales bacterium]
METKSGGRKLKDKSRQQNQQQLNDVLETLPCYLVLLTPDYHVPFANKFFRERFGESHGKRCYEYLFNLTAPCENCKTYDVLKTMRPQEWDWVGPDGRDYHIYDFPFKSADGSALIMEVGIDVTLQNKALAELKQTRDNLESSVEERTQELKKLNRLLRVKMVEHKQAEQRFRQVSEEWQATFDSITDMVSIQDNESRLVRVNRAYANAVGMSCEALIGRKCYEVMHHAECALTDCPHLETLKTKKSVTREIFEPGLGLFLQVTTSPIYDEARQLTGTVHIAKDISERKRAEEDLLHLNRELRAITDCNQAVVRAEDEVSLYKDVCRIMYDVVGYRMVWVGSVEHDKSKTVKPIASYGDETGYLPGAQITWADNEFGRGPTGIAARTGRTDFCQDFASESKIAPWQQAAMKRGFRSSISLPLKDSAGNVFAVFNLYAGQPNRFTPFEVDLLEELTGDISFGIQTIRERARRREAEENLRETRDYLDSLFNYANAPIIVWDKNFKITRFNHAFERLTGRTAVDVLDRHLQLLFPESTRSRSMQLIRQASSGKHWEVVEIPILTRDGAERILLWNSATIFGRDGSTVLGTIAQGQDITERRQADAAVRFERDRLMSILNSMTDGVAIINRERDVTFINPSLQGRLGEVNGRKCYEYFRGRKSVCEPCSHELILSGRIDRHEVVLGEPGVIYELTESPMANSDGSVSRLSIFHDVTDRKKYEAALLESEEKFAKAFRSNPAATSITDYEDGAFIDVNDAFTNILGYSRDELIGKKTTEVGIWPGAEDRKNIIDTLRQQGRVTSSEVSFRCKDGSLLNTLFSAEIITFGGRKCILGIAVDITERKKSEKLKDEFISLVSHELRTPLTVITGSLYTSLSPKISQEEIRELIQNAIGGADQLAAILENMLELSRHQAGRLTLHPEPVSVLVTVRSVINKLKAQEVTQKFTVDIPPELHPVEADPTRLERIIYNLVENATKYTPEGSLISISAQEDDKFIVVTVSDEGPGISPEDQVKLFELFHQLETRGPRRPGAGLGLVVCKRLVEAQGGWIKVDSAVGKGSRFSFALPRSKETG